MFGLFAVAVLLKLRLNLQKLVECLVLGQFVVKEVLQVGRSTAELLLHPLLSGDFMAAVHFQNYHSLSACQFPLLSYAI